jgi:hypothetical protein
MKKNSSIKPVCSKVSQQVRVEKKKFVRKIYESQVEASCGYRRIVVSEKSAVTTFIFNPLYTYSLEPSNAKQKVRFIRRSLQNAFLFYSLWTLE